MALTNEPFEACAPHDHVDDHDHVDAADDQEQFGLGRGLALILAGSGGTTTPRLPHADAEQVAEGRGLDALFPRAPAPPPLPIAPTGPRWRRVHAADAPRRDEIDAHLAALADALDLDVAAHVRPGPSGGRLVLHRPAASSLTPTRMDELCRAIRRFVASSQLTTDDLEAAEFHCVAFGPRPLAEPGVYVLGRQAVTLSLDERWAVHRRLTAARSG